MKKFKYQFDVVYGENDPYYKVGEKDSYIGVETSLERGLNGLSWFLDGGDYTITAVTLLETIEDIEPCISIPEGRIDLTESKYLREIAGDD